MTNALARGFTFVMAPAEAFWRSWPGWRSWGATKWVTRMALRGAGFKDGLVSMVSP